jgi:glycosyltransferase involved in cell wall biosynthesis
VKHSAGLPRKRWRLRAALSYFGGRPLDSVFPQTSLFHATEHLLPRLRSISSVFTLHDTAYLNYPEYHLPQNRYYLRWMMPRFLKSASAVIAVSEHTRQDAERHYRLDASKIHVIPEAVEARFRPLDDAAILAATRARFNLPDRFILFLGTLEPRKNLVVLLEAYALVRAVCGDVGLVIAGGKGWLYESFFEKLRSLQLEAHVRLTGHVPDADLPALLSCAEVFAFPSLFEGFGLPPLEAMACGVPVVCSNAASLPEVVGDAGIQLAPDDVREWAATLLRLLNDAPARADLRMRGLERARAFTWEAAARKTWAVYERSWGEGAGHSRPAA